MLEIDTKLAKKWSRYSNSFYFPNHLDVTCPHKNCGRSIVNIKLNWDNKTPFLWTAINCSGCGQRTLFFLIEPQSNEADKHKCKLFLYPALEAKLPLTIDSNVTNKFEEISPRFIQILSQLATAEQNSLDELSGIGYRKALEFLIKDYLGYKNKDSKEDIIKATLGQCINNYIDDVHIKECAKRAAWLGNDETHYLRKWNDKDIEDLKKLMQLTIYWITMELMTENYVKEMV